MTDVLEGSKDLRALGDNNFFLSKANMKIKSRLTRDVCQRIVLIPTLESRVVGLKTWNKKI